MGTGVLRLLGGEVRNRYVRSGPDSYSVIGETNTQPQVAKQVLSECAIPTSRQNLPQIQYLNPLPVARASAVQRSRLQSSERVATVVADLLYSSEKATGYSVKLACSF